MSAGSEKNQGQIWIQGAGELASGVAARLFRSGYQIILAEIANPLAVRRLVAFSEAVHEGRCQVEGIAGELATPEQARYQSGLVQVVVDPRGETLARLGAAAVIDARITKKLPEPLPCGTAPLIGLGCGFRCGRDADLIIETHREARLGDVLRQGEAAANTGIPGTIGGQSARRVVYTPVAGHFQPQVEIGEMVSENQVLGHVAEHEIRSRLDGQVRGLVHSKAELKAGEKVGDVDPRGLAIDPRLVSDKALAIGGGVLEALLSLGIHPSFGAGTP